MSNKAKVPPTGPGKPKVGESKTEVHKTGEDVKQILSGEAFADAKKKSMSIYGNLIMDQTSDRWDEGLIPQSLVDEIYAELQYEPGSDDSLESYEEVTESGTVLKKYRKKRRVYLEEEEESSEEEEEQKTGPRRISIADTEGGISKAKLKLMSTKKLNSVHKKIDVEIEFIETENFIMDRTVKKMEKRELEIEAALPAFTYQFPWEKINSNIKSKTRDTTQDTCTLNFSSDEEDNGVYVPFIPVNELDFSDPFFDDMSEEMREATTNQMKELGEIAPANFDVIRYTYGDLVKKVKNDVMEDNAVDMIEGRGVSQVNKDDLPSGSEAMLMSTGLEATIDTIEDEDPEFPGFVMKQAKKLPIGEKLKYANIEEESLRDEFFDDETKGIQQENSIQVYIDTFINSVELIRKLQESLKEVLSHGYHPLTGRMRAEVIVRFRILMRNRLLAEETKLTMALNELKKRKKKVDEQVKSNRELGESIQLIDYEQLRIENAEFQGNIDEQHDTLKQLKIVTASCFQQLKDHRAKLDKKMLQFKQIHEDINVRGTLKDGFNDSTHKYSHLLFDLKTHNEFLKKRLKVFKAPSTLDYMRQKALQNAIQEEIGHLQKKILSLDLNLNAARKNVQRLQRKIPAKDIRKLNTDWLEEVKREVDEKGLINLLDNPNEPMGGSMKAFFKNKKGKRGNNKEKEKKIIKKSDIDIASKIKLGQSESKFKKRVDERTSLFLRQTPPDDDDDRRGSKISEFGQWGTKEQSLRPPGEVPIWTVKGSLQQVTDNPQQKKRSTKTSDNDDVAAEVKDQNNRRKTLVAIKDKRAAEDRAIGKGPVTF